MGTTSGVEVAPRMLSMFTYISLPMSFNRYTVSIFAAKEVFSSKRNGVKDYASNDVFFSEGTVSMNLQSGALNYSSEGIIPEKNPWIFISEGKPVEVVLYVFEVFKNMKNYFFIQIFTIPIVLAAKTLSNLFLFAHVAHGTLIFEVPHSCGLVFPRNLALPRSLNDEVN